MAPETFVLYVALPIIFTVVCGLRFLIDDGFAKPRSTLLAFVALLLFIWIYPHLNFSSIPAGARWILFIVVNVGFVLLIIRGIED